MIKFETGAIVDLPNPFSEQEMNRLEEFILHRLANRYGEADEIKEEFLALGWELRPLPDGGLDVVEARLARCVDKEPESLVWFIDFEPPGLAPDLKAPVNEIIEARERGDRKKADELKAAVMLDKRVEHIQFSPNYLGMGINVCTVKLVDNRPPVDPETAARMLCDYMELTMKKP